MIRIPKRSRKKIRICKKSLAENKFYIGHFYYRTKRYKSALSRFQSVVATADEFPELQKKALAYINLCETAMKEKIAN